jgi:hypothetical protein
VRYWGAFEWVMAIVSTALGAFMVWAFFMVGYTLVAEAKCLEAGYPRSAVTWNLRQYCMNLEGSVTVKVEEIE